MIPGANALNQVRRITLSICLALVAMLTVPAPGLLPVVAQESDQYQAELVEWTIDISGPNYELEGVDIEEYPHGRGERIYVSSVEDVGFVEISFFDDEDPPEQAIELMLRDFRSASSFMDVLERGVANDVNYAFARFQLETQVFGYLYIEVVEDVQGNTDVAQSFYSLDQDFLEQLDVARSEIQIDERPFLAEPVIGLEDLVAQDQALLASTPEPVPTPDQGSYTYQTADVDLVVEGNIEFDFPLRNRELDVMFLESDHGYGVVGFIDQVAESPEIVMASVFLDAPAGEEAPQELYTESNDTRSFGVYRVETQGEIRAMVIEITRINENRWQVEAMAVTESEFASELENYQRGVLFNGESLLGDIDVDDILTILNDDE